MKHAITIILLFITALSCAQEVTSMTVVKKGDTTSNEDGFGEEANMRGFSNLGFWSVWNPITQKWETDFDLQPSISLEYDLSKEETAHFYDLGTDFGNDKLMFGLSARIPSHSPDNDDGRGIQYAFRAFKLVEFNQLVNPYLRSSKAPKANWQFGMEYIADTRKAAIGENPEPERRVYFTPFIGVFHPIFQNVIVGARYKYNFNLNGGDVSYAALALQCNFVIPLFD